MRFPFSVPSAGFGERTTRRKHWPGLRSHGQNANPCPCSKSAIEFEAVPLLRELLARFTTPAPRFLRLQTCIFNRMSPIQGEGDKSPLELEAFAEKSKTRVRRNAWRQAKAVCLLLLRPSTSFRSRNETKQLRKTAWLDGLRGFAALLVYWMHHQLWAHEGVWIFENAFGWDGNYRFVCFPGIRVFFSGGHAAVAVFFVISGYVLSLAPLRLLHEDSRLEDNLSSALFRRWVRLFLPVIATTFIFMTSWHLFNIRSGSLTADPPERTYAHELWKWYCDLKNFSFVFTSEVTNAYNDHLWSIPMEFRGSIVVYTSLLAFARCRTNVRLGLEAGLVLYFLYIVDGWYCALFMMGALLCDLHLLAEKDQSPAIFSWLVALQGWIYYVLIVLSLYLAGVPSISGDIAHLRKEPGWYLLSFMKPQAVFDFRWFYRFWAATFAMISIPRIPCLRSFFESRFCQYLGKISYGLYLVHGPVLWTLGDRIYAAVGRLRQNQSAVVPGWINLIPLPSWGPLGLEVNYLIPHLILLPSTLWLAEVVTKLFDEPSVMFSRWLFDKSVVPSKLRA